MSTPPLEGLRVLVSGAGVTGPALAYWLAEYGATTTVVEKAPALRTSGFAVDFRGPTHLGVLSRMGVLDKLSRLRTHGGAMAAVDEQDTEIFRLPAEFAGGDLEVRRRDLSAVFHAHSADSVEYVFGDVITGLIEQSDGVRVHFGSSPSRTVDLVVGADGLHSGVRGLVFGPERAYVRHLGFYLGGWDLPDQFHVGGVPRQYHTPGRMASVTSDERNPGTANAFVVFSAPRLDYDADDVRRQKEFISHAFRGLGWHVPELLAGLREAPELYFDSISRVSVPRWSVGRVALIGDAAWGVTLGGMGVGTGVVGAYVLAGELAAAGGDYRVAFPAYERLLRRYASRWQRGANPGQFLAPPTASRLWLRNTMFRSSLVRRLLVSGTRSLAADFELPEYPSLVAAGAFDSIAGAGRGKRPD